VPKRIKKKGPRLSPENHHLLLDLLRYDLETGVFYWIDARGGRAQQGDVAGSVQSHGYRHIRVMGHIYKAHRLAWFYINGVWPSKSLDHADLNRDNNAIRNLREATRQENGANTTARSNNKSGFKGVCFMRGYKNNWVAQINENGTRRRIGYFASPELAHAAYCEAAEAQFKHFARG
jgi:hypothetical protein